MADEPKGEDPMATLLLVLAGMGVLVFLWFASGAYKNADVKGLFIAPPPPVGPGGSYGPQIGQPNPDYPTNDQTQI
jgi:hypothetical protein